MNTAELTFIKAHCEGKLWFHQPRAFVLRELGRTYRPDFYVVENGCFYEIIGSRQAYSYQREDIRAFRSEYPQYRLEVVNVGAWKNGPRHNRVGADPSTSRGCLAIKRRLRSLQNPLADRLLMLMERHNVLSLSDMSIRTGIAYAVLYGRIRSSRNPALLDDISLALERNSLT